MRHLYYIFGDKEIEISVDSSEIKDCTYDALDKLSKKELIELFLDCVDEDDMFDFVFDDLYERNESVARDILDNKY